MPDAKSWAHLVGSVPLPDAESVFRTVSEAWGPHLRRISDGETGRRGRWIWFQREMLEQHLAMEPDPDEPPYALYQWDGQLLRETSYIRFRPGVDPSAVDFPTGYAEAALESFDLYARDDGLIPGCPVPGVAAHAHGHGVHVREPGGAGRVYSRLRTVVVVGG